MTIRDKSTSIDWGSEIKKIKLLRNVKSETIGDFYKSNLLPEETPTVGNPNPKRVFMAKKP